MKKTPCLPTIKELASLIMEVKKDICDDYVDEPGGVPYILLTVGANLDTPGWNYQTGDNSFIGGAYMFRHWAVEYVTLRCNSRKMAKDIRDAFSELWHQYY